MDDRCGQCPAMQGLFQSWRPPACSSSTLPGSFSHPLPSLPRLAGLHCPPTSEMTDPLGPSTFSLLLPPLYTLCPGSAPQVSSLPVPWAVGPVATVFRAQYNLALFLSATWSASRLNLESGHSRHMFRGPSQDDLARREYTDHQEWACPTSCHAFLWHFLSSPSP